MIEKITFNLKMHPEEHKEIKSGCDSLGISMTSLIIRGALKELRNRLKLEKQIDRMTTVDYSNR